MYETFATKNVNFSQGVGDCDSEWLYVETWPVRMAVDVR
jgi:hypothetical protein